MAGGRREEFRHAAFLPLHDLRRPGADVVYDFGKESPQNRSFVKGWAAQIAERGREAARFRRQPGKEWSVYCCDTSLRLDPYRYYRLHPWKNFDLKAKFISIYQFYEQQPGTDFRRVPAGGLAYDTAEELVPSVRLENLRIGMTDVKYMKLLERLATGDSSEAAREARNFLKKAPGEVVRIYPHDSFKADEMRSRAIELILKLKARKP